MRRSMDSEHKTGWARAAVVAGIAVAVLLVVAAVVYGLVFIVLAPMM